MKILTHSASGEGVQDSFLVHILAFFAMTHGGMYGWLGLLTVAGWMGIMFMN